VLLMVILLSALLAYLTEPPMTPSQLRKAMGRGEEELPPPKKPEPHAQPQVMPQKKVRCFEPNDLPKARYPEMDRQLGGQERGLNEMTVDEYLKGRNAFDPANRDPRIAKVARAECEQDLTRKLKEQLI
jgi:Novel toxin 15